MRQEKTSLAVLAMMIAFAAPVTSTQAETVLTAFDNFNLDGLFSSWTSATVVSTPTNYSITASGFGSGFKALSPTIDATGETRVELTVTLSGSGAPSSPISGPIVSLVDTNGTFYNYAWYGQTAGKHVLTLSLATPTFITATGSVANLDLSKLAFFHLQDDPGAYSSQYTITFELLRLTGAPVPRIAAPSYDPGTGLFTLTWNSLSGKNYTILYSPDLVSPFSALVTDVPSGGSSTTTIVTLPSNSTGYLRVQQQ